MRRPRNAILAATLLAPAVLFAAPAPPAAAEAREGAAAGGVTVVEFRDLFAPNGKPNLRAAALRGRQVAMQGFLTPPPAEDSPFRVLVGAPTEHCPYCTSVNETEHLPYILVYPAEGASVPEGGRLIVIGTLDPGLPREPAYGLHYDLRLTDAVLLPASVLARGQRRTGTAATPDIDAEEE
jgi:hypothetical protein